MTSGDDTDRRERARKAIRRLAEEHGLQTELTILSERWNTVAELGNSGVIARAATLADLVREDPVDAYHREVHICRELVERGAPVQEPVSDVYVVDGFPISLWRKVDGITAGASIEAMVSSLAEIHRLGADISLDEPWFALIAEGTPHNLQSLSRRGIVDDSTFSRLHDYFSRCLDRITILDPPGGLIHGDAQRKNSMAVGDDCIWIDWEDSCSGPYAWDLACLAMNPAYDDDHVLDLYAEFSGLPRFTNAVLDDLKRLRDLDALMWMMSIQEERELAFQQEATARLQEILAADV
ncbi:MAG: phosphotransferase [Thermomicrobiales bacterium]|nr:phosphotransferase [Thermomicrobiales bacterium]